MEHPSTCKAVNKSKDAKERQKCYSVHVDTIYTYMCILTFGSPSNGQKDTGTGPSSLVLTIPRTAKL